MKQKLLLPLLALVLMATACKKSAELTDPAPVTNPTPVTPVIPPDNDPILLGNPTNAVGNHAISYNYLLNHIYWTAGYDDTRGTATWISWHFQSDDIGSTPRQDDFRPDNFLHSSYYLVQHSSYSGSGFDRGHNCPSGDRTSSVSANSSTFYMTNIIPQAPMLNQGPWEGLETYIRNSLVGTSNEAYTIMGNYGSGGVASTSVVQSIDNGHVTVPANIWKVVVVMPKGNNDLTRLSNQTIVLAVNMPNNNTLYNTSGSGKDAWRNYLTSIDVLEQKAIAAGVKLDLLTNVPEPVRTVLKSKTFQ
jgi:endonuclease G, mitochondrial